MYSCVAGLPDLPFSDEEVSLALVVPEGMMMATTPVSNEEGTFLALSPNPRARVIASIVALTEMRSELGYASSR